MKFAFAGVGSAFTDQRYYQSNMIVRNNSKNLLIDCGTDARFSLGEFGVTPYNVGHWVDGVYISHLHSDHIGGLEFLGFCSYFNKSAPKPKLYIVDTLVDELWDSLKGGMRSHEGVCLRLESYFDIQAIKPNSSFYWEGISFTPVQTVHIMDGFRIVPSYGLIFNEMKANAKTVFLTTDTQFAPRQIEVFYERADVIFHDCETYDFRSKVHAHYDDLKTLPPETKQKMWLYHYGPDPKQDPVKDGFQGFVYKGQSFDF